MYKRIFTSITNKIHELPVLVLMPHSRCNCRCVMCDIWKANAEKRELSVDDIRKHVGSFKNLGVKRVALSGGEALMHTNLWALCEALKGIGIKISLLSTGITLRNHATEVIKNCDDVIVSLDGSPPIHDQIRNLPNAFAKLAEGVRALKVLNASFKVTGRCVIQKSNFKDFEGILMTAYELGFNQISFLPADVSSTAFNRPEPWQKEKVVEVALNLEEAEELETIIKSSNKKFEDLYINNFIAESPQKLLQIVHYFKAVSSAAPFPKRKCNAPWVSAVIESNGDVLPCFFHKPYGNVNDNGFDAIINSEKAVRFRKELDVSKDSICEKCVCSLHLGFLQSP
jgi:Fe-coproporphyrin III synthase